MRELIFTPKAGADVKAIYRWYESQQRGLGAEIRTSVEALTTQIQRSPERFRRAADSFHRALLRRFPFEIFYEFDDHKVVLHLAFFSHFARPSTVARSVGPQLTTFL
jgi:plasmid stabilization system protein ParE